MKTFLQWAAIIVIISIAVLNKELAVVLFAAFLIGAAIFFTFGDWINIQWNQRSLTKFPW